MMKALTDCYTLANGVKIPCIGFEPGRRLTEGAVSSVLSALEAGYRHIDGRPRATETRRAWALP